MNQSVLMDGIDMPSIEVDKISSFNYALCFAKALAETKRNFFMCMGCIHQSIVQHLECWGDGFNCTLQEIMVKNGDDDFVTPSMISR